MIEFRITMGMNLRGYLWGIFWITFRYGSHSKYVWYPAMSWVLDWTKQRKWAKHHHPFIFVFWLWIQGDQLPPPLWWPVPPRTVRQMKPSSLKLLLAGISSQQQELKETQTLCFCCHGSVSSSTHSWIYPHPPKQSSCFSLQDIWGYRQKPSQLLTNKAEAVRSWLLQAAYNSCWA